ncbi:MAG TPA: site-2 protease family protein [Candidatus Bathyarchaeia archaeon]|nr:site-2 protease family protein [Candidatus Bathyarchaeia archaeon]
MSLQVGKIKGIKIRLHFTLLIGFLLISWSAAMVFTQHHYHGFTATGYWIVGAIIAAMLFISVLLHELAHSLVALRYGIKIRQIILFIFGGVSDISEEPKDYRKEATMALAGPAMSFMLAGIFTIFGLLVSQSTPTGSSVLILKQVTLDILYYAALINAILGIFNLIPAFPSDGGRILRAALVKLKKDYDKATKDAVKVGIVISYGFMVFGFLMMAVGSFLSGIWMLLIGWFLNSGAQSYLSQHELSSVLSHVRLREIMNTNIISVKQDITVNELLDSYFNVYRKTEFPVVDENGNLIGAVTTKQAMNVQKGSRDTIKVEEIMIDKDELIVMKADASADEALKRIFRENKSRIFVYEDRETQIRELEDGIEVKEKEIQKQKLIGLISKTDILNVAREREEFEKAVDKLGSSNKHHSTSSSDNTDSTSYSAPLAYKFNIISRQRFLFLAFGMIIFVIAYSVGSIFVKINTNEAEIIKRHFQQELRGVNQYKIFINNFKVALGMFVPGFGVALGMFSGFSTGLVYNAVSHTSPVVSHISPLIVFLTPFGILEIIAYGLAISRSCMLSYQLIKDRNKRKTWYAYVIPTAIEIGMVLLILLIAAITEWQMVQSNLKSLTLH